MLQCFKQWLKSKRALLTLQAQDVLYAWCILPALVFLCTDEDGLEVLSRLCYKPAGIKRTCSSWTWMLITAFVMIRNQSDARATGALEFPRSSSEDRHVPLVFFRSPRRHSKRSARLQVLSKVFWEAMKNGFLEINPPREWRPAHTRPSQNISWFKCIMNAFKIPLAEKWNFHLKRTWMHIFPQPPFRESGRVIKGIVHQEINILSSRHWTAITFLWNTNESLKNLVNCSTYMGK